MEGTVKSALAFYYGRSSRVPLCPLVEGKIHTKTLGLGASTNLFFLACLSYESVRNEGKRSFVLIIMNMYAEQEGVGSDALWATRDDTIVQPPPNPLEEEFESLVYYLLFGSNQFCGT